MEYPIISTINCLGLINIIIRIMVKAYDLRTKDEKGLIEELSKLKAELAKARIGKVAAAATQVKASKIKVSFI